MYKKIFFLLLFTIILGSSVSAGDVDKTGGYTRITSMGANPFIMDPFNATVNPAWGAYYSDFVFADIGTAAAAFGPGGNGQFFAGFFGLNKNLVLGAFLTRNDFAGFGISRMDPGAVIGGGLGVVPGLPALPFNPLSVVSAHNAITGGPAAPAFDNNVELLGAYTNKNITIGFGVSYAKRSTERVPFKPPAPALAFDTESASSQIGFNVGVLLKAKKLLVDVGVSLIMPSASSIGNGTATASYTETKASQTIILATARAYYEMSKKVTVVPMASFTTVSGTIDSGGVPNAAGVVRGSGDMVSASIIGFGVGFIYKVGDFLLAGGPSLYTASFTVPAVANANPELKQSAFIFPVWNIGMEWQLLKWLVGRMGYVAATGSATTELPANATNINEATNPIVTPTNRGLTMGVGFRFGDFRLDGYVNEDVLRQGFAIIGGSGNAAGTFRTFFLMSASYALP